jgi:hypothetical protein
MCGKVAGNHIPSVYRKCFFGVSVNLFGVFFFAIESGKSGKLFTNFKTHIVCFRKTEGGRKKKEERIEKIEENAICVLKFVKSFPVLPALYFLYDIFIFIID